MKRIGNNYYKKVRFSDGKKYLVRMSDAEVIARDYYWSAVFIVPVLGLIAMCWAAGVF